MKGKLRRRRSDSRNGTGDGGWSTPRPHRTVALEDAPHKVAGHVATPSDWRGVEREGILGFRGASSAPTDLREGCQ